MEALGTNIGNGSLRSRASAWLKTAGVQDPFVLLYYLGVLTVSFDIFLVINLGFNFRFSQIAWGLPIAASLLFPLFFRRLILPLGFTALWVWFVFIVAFVPNAGLLSRGLGYAFWLGYNLALIFATVCFFHRRDRLMGLMKWYLVTFFLIALFGLFQFASPLLGLPSFLVVQWWPGGIPRPNGFSYEPSYYASYLLTGWITTAYLLKKNSPLFNPRFLKVVFYTTLLAIFLSSSRMGWIMVALWYLQYPANFFFRLILGRLNRNAWRITALLGLAALAAVLIIQLIGSEKLIFLLNGLGLAGTSGHSSGTRLQKLSETFQLFLESPWLGYSLGGVAPAIGALRGVAVNTLEVAKLYEGMAIFMEVLAASGIVGVIPFILYVALLIGAPLLRAAKLEDRAFADLLRALVIALIFEFAILQFNQNILRLYLWLHIAILSAAFASARLGKSQPSLSEGRLEIAEGGGDVADR